MANFEFNKPIGFAGNLIRAEIIMEPDEVIAEPALWINDVEKYQLNAVGELIWITVPAPNPEDGYVPVQVYYYFYDLEELIKNTFFINFALPNILTSAYIAALSFALAKIYIKYKILGTPLQSDTLYCLDAWKDEAEFGSFDIDDYFSEGNYLSNLPQVNEICIDTPQFIHILIDTVNYAITQDIAINYTDGTSDTASFSYNAQGLHKVLQFPVGYSQLGLDSLNTLNKTVYSYTVSFTGVAGQDTFEWKTLTFLLKDNPLNSIVFCFKNAFGVPQTFMASGNLAEKKLSLKKDINEKPRDVAVNKLTGRYLGKIREKKNTYTASTGYLSRTEMVCFEELLQSENVYVLESDNSFTKVEIAEAEYKTLQGDEEYNAVVFEYVK